MALTAGQTGHLADHQEGVYTVVHGATAGTTRPTLGSSSTAPTVVLWVGSVEPTNAVNNDLWMDTTSGSPNSKVKVSGSFVTAGSGTYLLPGQSLTTDELFATHWLTPPVLSVGTSSFATNQFRGTILDVQVAMSVDRIACEVTSSAGSATARLGIYRIDGTLDNPLELVVDAGDIDASTTGVKEIVIAEDLAVGRYVVGAAPQGAVAGYRSATTSLSSSSSAMTTTAAPRPALLFGSVSGALPSAPSASRNFLAPRVILRQA